MNSKLIGGILLIVGTSIGGGMLALPVSTAQGGFLGSLILLFSSWLVMTFGAFLILEVNLWLPKDSNLISMSKMTLGHWGEVIAWISYLLLLYSLLSAYISGGSDVLHGLFSMLNFDTSQKSDAIIFLIILGAIVFLGIQSTDYVNRLLLVSKLGAFLLLVAFIVPHVHYQYLNALHGKYLISALTVVITSFGFATIIPSLRSYFNDDVVKLRVAILVGSLIPLICYIVWVGIILGEIPLTGVDGLIAMLTSPQPTSALVQSLHDQIHDGWISSASHVFTSLCVATSFLGVALCLSDFLSDGLKIKKTGIGKMKIFALTYVPPLLVALFYPEAFLVSLSYAGIFCVILLIVMPALMAWRGRYILNMAGGYRVKGGKFALGLAILIGSLIILQNLYINIIAAL